MDQSTLLWGLLWGSVGMGDFIYGKKQKKNVPFACGLVLMGFPYVVENPWALAGIGLAVMAVPFVIKQ